MVMLGLTFQVQAFDKSEVNLDEIFWGTWTIYNAEDKCLETYQFTKPSTFQYLSLQKRMQGDFAVLRNTQEVADLYILKLRVVTDNQKASCADRAQVSDYRNADLSLALKWITKGAAQLCADIKGNHCSNLYMVKKENK